MKLSVIVTAAMMATGMLGGAIVIAATGTNTAVAQQAPAADPSQQVHVVNEADWKALQAQLEKISKAAGAADNIARQAYGKADSAETAAQNAKTAAQNANSTANMANRAAAEAKAAIRPVANLDQKVALITSDLRALEGKQAKMATTLAEHDAAIRKNRVCTDAINTRMAAFFRDFADGKIVAEGGFIWWNDHKVIVQKDDQKADAVRAYLAGNIKECAAG